MAPPGSNGVRGARWLRWAAPDVAVLVSAVTLGWCLGPFDAGHKLFRDSDTGWHIRTGERILDAGALPRTDPYSFSRAGAPWLAWEWGSDLLMGIAHRIDGLRGVTTLYVVAISLCTWMWFRLSWAFGGDFFVACALASPMLSTVNLHWLARPHVLGWLLLLGTLLYAERGARTWWIALAGTALWANLHASFFLGPLILGIYALGEWARPRIWRAEPDPEAVRRYSIAAVAAAMGSFLNPHGWRLHQHVAGYLSNSELLDRVGEFQSFNFRADGSLQILVALGIAAIGGVAALLQQRLAHFLLAALFLAIALRSARGLPIAALALLPIANGAITRALREARGLRISLSGFFEYSGRLREIDKRLGGPAFAAVLLVAAALLIHSPALAVGFPETEFPVSAARAVDNLPAGARILAPDKYGGYLIYRFDGARKVYFDGRSDFYGLEFMKEYIGIIEARPGWREAIRRYAFTHALLPNRYTLAGALEQAGWRPIYKDDVATLLEAK